jgi:PhnB protein
MPLADQFWGDRWGLISDPFGHGWGIGTHKEDLTPEQMMERSKAAMAQMGANG